MSYDSYLIDGYFCWENTLTHFIQMMFPFISAATEYASCLQLYLKRDSDTGML